MRVYLRRLLFFLQMLSLAGAVVWAHVSHAEYRAFELVITDAAGKEKVVISTLDPEQYKGYHPLNAGETITYRATWMCRGNTSGRQKVCPKTERGPRSGPG